MPVLQEGRYAPPVHMIKLTETRESRLTSGCIRDEEEVAAGLRRRTSDSSVQQP
jgi:hypothetical protein